LRRKHLKNVTSYASHLQDVDGSVTINSIQPVGLSKTAQPSTIVVKHASAVRLAAEQKQVK